MVSATLTFTGYLHRCSLAVKLGGAAAADCHLVPKLAGPVQVLLGSQIEEEPPGSVFVYESTVDCLKQTEEILQTETSFGFLVDPDSSVEQSMQELMQDLCSGPSESA